MINIPSTSNPSFICNESDFNARPGSWLRSGCLITAKHNDSKFFNILYWFEKAGTCQQAKKTVPFDVTNNTQQQLHPIIPIKKCKYKK